VPVTVIPESEFHPTVILIGGRKLSKRFYEEPIEDLGSHHLHGLRAIESFYPDLLAVMSIKNYRAVCFPRGLGGLKADWQVFHDQYDISEPCERVKKIARFDSWLRAIERVEGQRMVAKRKPYQSESK